jgi:hypothetical protein
MQSTVYPPIYREPPVKKIISIRTIRVSVVELVLFKSVRVMCEMLDDDYVPFDNRYYTIEGEQYAAWGNDDKYLATVCIERLREEFSTINL